MQPAELLEIFILPLHKGKIDYMVTGSVASIIYGEPRLTHDVDLVLFFDEDQVPDFIKIFPDRDFYCPPEEIIILELKRDSQAHFNLIHHQSGLKADCYPHTGDKLESWAFENRKQVSLGNNFSLWLAPPEYVIIRKMQFFREGNSPKHIKDIRSIFKSGNRDVDETIIMKWVKYYRLEPVWDQIRS